MATDDSLTACRYAPTFLDAIGSWHSLGLAGRPSLKYQTSLETFVEYSTTRLAFDLHILAVPYMAIARPQNLARLNCVAAQTVAAFAVDNWLQNQLLHAGVIWHLMLFTFIYDYTLDEGGIDTSDETNQQVRGRVDNTPWILLVECVGAHEGFRSPNRC